MYERPEVMTYGEQEVSFEPAVNGVICSTLVVCDGTTGSCILNRLT